MCTVTFFYYWNRLAFTFIISLLTVRIGLMSAFILDFDRMLGEWESLLYLLSGFSDCSVQVGTLGLSGLVSMVGLVVEMVVKGSSGSGHIGASSLYLYMGARHQDLHSGFPWFSTVAAIHTAGFAATLMAYTVIKYR